MFHGDIFTFLKPKNELEGEPVEENRPVYTRCHVDEMPKM